MRTEADEHLENAKSYIANALAEINEIVFVRCDGWNTWSPIDMQELGDVHSMLIRIRNSCDRCTNNDEF